MRVDVGEGDRAAVTMSLSRKMFRPVVMSDSQMKLLYQ
jgi:hypothetical protein